MNKVTFSGALAGAFLLATFVSRVQAEPQWSLLVKGERDHQEFSSDNADIDTLTLQPSVVDGNWSVSATLPWQRIDGTVFVNKQYSSLSAYPKLSSICSSGVDLSGNQILEKICNNSSKVVTVSQDSTTSGWGDFEIFANYVFPVNWQHVNTSLGAGYKHDNGDDSTGLGTGTQDVYAENAWLVSVSPLSFLLTLGYNHIVHDSTGLDLKDHAYYGLDSRWQFADWAALGVEYDYQQSNSDLFDDYDYYTGYLRLGRPKGWGGRLFVIDYHGQDGFPDQEYGASLSYLF